MSVHWEMCTNSGAVSQQSLLNGCLCLSSSHLHTHTLTPQTHSEHRAQSLMYVYTPLCCLVGDVHYMLLVLYISFRQLLYSLFPYLPMVIAVYELVRLSRIYTVTLFMCQVNVWLVRVHSAAIHSVSHTPSHLSLMTNY